MKKILLIFLCLIITSVSYGEEYLTRDYDGIEVPKGTFISVTSLQDFSTAYSDETTKLKFVSNNDVFIFETKIIPKGTMFYGYIEKKNEPIIGTHGSMIVRITHLVFADGFMIPIRAYIHSTNGNKIGGGLTTPATYLKMPHYQKHICRHFVGVLQSVPGDTRKMGEHVTVASGACLLIELVEPTYITHTLTD